MINGENKFGKYFWGSVIFLHIFYFVTALILKNIYMADSYEYLQQAFNIKNYSSFYCLDFSQPINIFFFTKRPPLYGLIIFVFKIVYNSDFIVLFFQNLLSILNIYGLVKILKEYDFQFDVRKIVFVFVLLFPSQFIYNNMVMSEILLQTLILWAFYNIFYFLREKISKYIIYYNIFISLAVLTKPVLLFFWIPNLIFMLYFFIKQKNYSVLYSGLFLPVTILSLSLYNYNVTGSFHYSSIKQMNYFGYNASLLLVKVKGEEEGIKKIKEMRSTLDTISDFSIKMKETDRLATEVLMENKFEYAKFHLKGMLNYFIDPGRFDLNNFLGVKEKNNSGFLYAFTKEGYKGIINFIFNQPLYMVFYLIIIFAVNIFMFIIILILPFIKKVSPEIKIFILGMILYMCFFSGILGTMRYKIHIYPLILFTIPFAVELFYDFFHKDSQRKEKIHKGNS